MFPTLSLIILFMAIGSFWKRSWAEFLKNRGYVPISNKKVLDESVARNGN